MTQNLFSYQYQESSKSAYTSLGGLPLFMEMAKISGLSHTIKCSLKLNTQGWSDQEIIESIMQLNISGGDCVEDIDRLEADQGLNNLTDNLAYKGMTPTEKEEAEKRFRTSTERAFPSASSIRRYLEKFHNEEEEEKRLPETAFIPAQNGALKSLISANQKLVTFLQKQHPCQEATLDQDATLAQTHKESALYCYEKYKAYQPFNTYWHEQKILLHTEFRDGNVPAGFEQKRLLEESLNLLPQGVKKVFLRSDTAGYQENLLTYCAAGHNERFGVIEFAIGVKVTPAFKESVKEIEEKDWHMIYKTDEEGNKYETTQEWAEVCFVPAWAAKSKKNPDYRFIAIRELFSAQPCLPGIETTSQDLPFQTMASKSGEFKIFGVITNRDLPGNELIEWYRKRCGDSEKVHSIEKSDLCGGQFPSNKFGANAAWWHIMVLTFNLIVLMKSLVLPKEFMKKRMKGLRFHLIHIAGCVIQHARQLIIKISKNAKIMNLIQSVRHRLEALATAPPLIST